MHPPTSVTEPPPPQPAHRRAWLGWTIVGLAAVLVVASFLWSSDDDPASAKSGGPRVTPVTAAQVERTSITERGRYPGELDADAADVAAFYAGRLVAVRVRVGDTVKAGDVVAELDPVDAREQIAQARAQATAARAEESRAKIERDAAEAEAARLEPLAKDKLISALEIDRQRAKANALAATVQTAAAGEAEARARVKLLEKRLSESVVRAPFAARIAERYVDPGAIVSAGARLVRLVQIAPLRVRFEVPEHEVADLTPGRAVRVVTSATAKDPAAGVTAKITGIAGEISRARRVATLEALIEEPPPGWLPGMYAEAIVDRRTLDGALVVPTVAVLSRLTGSTVGTGVFVADEGVARWVPVTVTARQDDRVAIEGKLTAGASVLVAGHVDLSDGSKIAITEAAPAGRP